MKSHVTAAVFGFILLAAATAGWVVLSGPAEAQTAQFNDGTYFVESEPDGRGRQALIEVTILNGEIVGVHYDEVERDDDGEVVMSKINNYGYAEGWRRGRDGDTTQLSAIPAYINQLIAEGDVDGVDLVTGATSTHDNFRAVAQEALDKARR